MTSHANRAKILDVRETRTCARFEVRENPATSTVVLEGYAATYEPYDVYGGESRGGWREQIQPTAFDTTLATSPDVQLLVNHEGCPLARTKSGTLQLSRDRHGLRVRALLDRNDPDVQALLPKMARGDMDEMSFGFRVKDQIWDANYTQRTITEVSLQKGDVSVVNYGANPGTRVVIGDAVEALASLSSNELVELRKLDPTRIEAAARNIAAWVPSSVPAVQDTRAGTPPPPDVPPEIDDRDENDDIEGPGTEAFTGNDMIQVGPIAAALSRTITDAYKLALDNQESTITLLAKAAELLERARTGETDIALRLRTVREGGRLPSQVRIEEALVAIQSVSAFGDPLPR
jgi:HK97 family phage prohead protease